MRWRWSPSTLDEVLRAVTDEVSTLVDPAQPLVLFGESFGGLVAYEVTRRLGAKGRWPTALVLAACEPPMLRGDPADVEAFVRSGLATTELDEDSAEQMLELVRRDVRLTVGYEPPAVPGVETEVHVWGGDGDELATAGKLDAWGAFLGRTVARRQFSGGHVFAMHHTAEITRALGSLAAPQGVSC
jgi:surfactin synthase thioesterase subunit